MIVINPNLKRIKLPIVITKTDIHEINDTVIFVNYGSIRLGVGYCEA